MEDKNAELVMREGASPVPHFYLLWLFLFTGIENLLDQLAHLFVRDAEFEQGLSSNTILLTEQAQQHVLRPDIVMAEGACLLHSQLDTLLPLLCHTEHMAADWLLSYRVLCFDLCSYLIRRDMQQT